MRRSPHHDGSPLYVSTPTPALGDTVEVRVRVPHDFGAVAVSTRSNPNREPRFSEASVVHSDDVWDWWQASVVVENPAHGYRFLFELADGSQRWLNATGLHEIETLDAEDFTLVGVSQPGFGAPAWARSSVMYQVFRTVSHGRRVRMRAPRQIGRSPHPGVTRLTPSRPEGPNSFTAATWTGSLSTSTTWPTSG